MSNFTELRRIELHSGSRSPLWRLGFAAPYAERGTPLQQNFPVRVLATGGSQTLRAEHADVFSDGTTRETVFEVPVALWVRAGRLGNPPDDGETSSDDASLTLHLDGYPNGFDHQSFRIFDSPAVIARPITSDGGWPEVGYESSAQKSGGDGRGSSRERGQATLRLPHLEVIDADLVLEVFPGGELAKALARCGGVATGALAPTRIRLTADSLILEAVSVKVPGSATPSSDLVSVRVQRAPALKADGRAIGEALSARWRATLYSGDGPEADQKTSALAQRLWGDVVRCIDEATLQPAAGPRGCTVVVADRGREPEFGWDVFWNADSTGALRLERSPSDDFVFAAEALSIRVDGNDGGARIVVPECRVRFSPERLQLNAKWPPSGTSENQLHFRWTSGSKASFELSASSGLKTIALRYDPYRLASCLRRWQGLPSAPSPQSSSPSIGTSSLSPPAPPASECLWVFQPLNRGWLQWPLPNLPEMPAPNDARAIPKLAESPSVIRGQWRIAANAGANAVIPGSIFVEHADGVDLKLEFARSAGKWSWAVCELTLFGVRGECSGLFWLGTGRPDELDALPSTVAGAASFEAATLAFGGAGEPVDDDIPVLSTTGLSMVLESGSTDWSFHPQDLQVNVMPGPLPRAWLRHPKVPLVAQMPMTRTANEASDPLRSRELAPFVLQAVDASVTGVEIVLNWKAVESSSDPWPVVDEAKVKLTPDTDWVWPAVGLEGSEPQRAVAFASIGAPGVEVAPTLGWSKTIDAYRHDVPLLDEYFARAELPPSEESTDAGGLGGVQEISKSSALAATANRPESLAGLWRRLTDLHALTRVQHSYAISYAVAGTGQRTLHNVVLPGTEQATLEFPFNLAGASFDCGHLCIGRWAPATSNEALEGRSYSMRVPGATGGSTASVDVLGWAAGGWSSRVEGGPRWVWDMRGTGMTGWSVFGGRGGPRSVRLRRTVVVRAPSSGLPDADADKPLAKVSTLKPVTVRVGGVDAWRIALIDLPMALHDGAWRWNEAVASKVIGEGWLGVDGDALSREHAPFAEWRFELAAASIGVRAPDDDLLALGGLWFEPLRIVEAVVSEASGLDAVGILGRLYVARSDRDDRLNAPLCRLSLAISPTKVLALDAVQPVTIVRAEGKVNLAVSPDTQLKWSFPAQVLFGTGDSDAAPVSLLATLPNSMSQMLGGETLPLLQKLTLSMLLCGFERTIPFGDRPWPMSGEWIECVVLTREKAVVAPVAGTAGALQGLLQLDGACFTRPTAPVGGQSSVPRRLALYGNLALHDGRASSPLLSWSIKRDQQNDAVTETLRWLGTTIEVPANRTGQSPQHRPFDVCFDSLRGSVSIFIGRSTQARFDVCAGLAMSEASISGGAVFVFREPTGLNLPGPISVTEPIEIRAGHVELLAVRHRSTEADAKGSRDLRSDGIQLERVLMRGEVDTSRPSLLPPSLQIWGGYRGVSSIAWPSVEVSDVDGSSNRMRGVRAVRAREADQAWLHQVKFDYSGAPLFCEALEWADSAMRLRLPWEMTVAVRHVLGSSRDGDGVKPDIRFISMQTMSFSDAAGLIGAEPAAAAFSTFAARYRSENNPEGSLNPAVLHPGIVGRSTALQGFDGQAFRDAAKSALSTAELSAADKAILLVTGKALVWLSRGEGAAIAGESTASWVELPFLRAESAQFDWPAAKPGGLAQRAVSEKKAGVQLSDADAVLPIGPSQGRLVQPAFTFAMTSINQTSIEALKRASLTVAGASGSEPTMQSARAVEQFFAEPSATEGALDHGAYWMRSLVTISAMRHSLQKSAQVTETLDAVSLVPISGQTNQGLQAVVAGTASVRMIDVAHVAGQEEQGDIPREWTETVLLSCGDREDDRPVESRLATDSAGSSMIAATRLDALPALVRGTLRKIHRRAAYAVRLERHLTATAAGNGEQPLALSLSSERMDDDPHREFMLPDREMRPNESALSASPDRGWSSTYGAATNSGAGPALGPSVPTRAPVSGVSGWTDPVGLPWHVSVPEDLAPDATSVAGGNLVWLSQRRQPPWLPTGLKGLIGPTPGWLHPGRLRQRLPAKGAIPRPLPLPGVSANAIRNMQAFLPPVMEATTVGARAGVVHVERYELVQTCEDLMPFDKLHPRFGQAAKSSSQVVRHVRSPRPGRLPANVGDRRVDRRLQVSAARFSRACRVIAGPAEVLRSIQFADVPAGPQWTAWIAVSEPAGARLDRKWPGLLTVVIDVEVVGVSDDTEWTMEPMDFVQNEVLGRDAGAQLVVGDRRIELTSAAPLVASADWQRSTPSDLDLERASWRASATLALNFDANAVFRAVAESADPQAAAAIRLALLVGASLPRQTKESPPRPQQRVEFALHVDDASSPRPAIEPLSVLFNDPAYESELQSSPVRASCGGVVKGAASEPWEAVLYCDRTRIDHRSGFALMLDVRPQPSATGVVSDPNSRALVQDSMAERIKLSVGTISRDGSARALRWLVDGRESEFRECALAEPLAGDLMSLRESDGSPARLAHGDQVIFAAQSKTTGLDSSEASLEVDLSKTQLSLRLPVVNDPVIPPPAAFIALLRASPGGVSVPASATSPMPHRVGNFDLRADLRRGLVRRSVDFRWIVSEPSAASGELKFHVTKIERSGQGWFPEAENDWASIERLEPQGVPVEPPLSSGVEIVVVWPTAAKLQALRAQPATNADLIGWGVHVDAWLRTVSEACKAATLAPTAAAQLLTEAEQWGGIAVGVLLRALPSSTPVTTQLRWHQMQCVAALSTLGSPPGYEVSVCALSRRLDQPCSVIAMLLPPASVSAPLEMLPLRLNELIKALGSVVSSSSNADDLAALRRRIEAVAEPLAMFNEKAPTMDLKGPIARIVASSGPPLAWLLETSASVTEMASRAQGVLRSNSATSLDGEK